MPNNPTIYYKRDVIFSYLYLGPKKWPLIRFKILSAILGRWVWLPTFVLFISSNNQTRWNHIKNQCSGQSVWLPTCCSPVGFPPSIQVLLSRGIITIFYLYLIFRHARVSSTYPCQMSVRRSIRRSHFRISWPIRSLNLID